MPEIEELEPEVDEGAYSLDGGEPEGAEEAAPEQTAAGSAAEEPAEPQTPEEWKARYEELSKERDHYKGASSANWMRYKELRETIQHTQPQQQPQQPAKPKEEEKPPEYDPENPVPYIKWQQEQTTKGVTELRQMIEQQRQEAQVAEQQRMLAEVDNRGAQMLVHAKDNDPAFDSAMKYVTQRAFALEQQRQPTDEEAQAAVFRHNFLWFRQQILQGRNPIEDMKQHAQSIGWQAPPASPAQQQPQQRPGAAQKRPDPFRRPSTPRASGANGTPKIKDFQSEEEFFEAMDSGALTEADVERQLSIVLPGVA
jgi:hypothetical protein